jgi:hypothetical protein
MLRSFFAIRKKISFSSIPPTTALTVTPWYFFPPNFLINSLLVKALSWDTVSILSSRKICADVGLMIPVRPSPFLIPISSSSFPLPLIGSGALIIGC